MQENTDNHEVENRAENVARNQFGMPLWMLVLVACGVPIERLLRVVMWTRKWRKR